LPTAGCCDLLLAEGFAGGRLTASALMKRMGVEALYRKPNTFKPASKHQIYSDLMRTLSAKRFNQVWAMNNHLCPNSSRVCLSGSNG
jgi:putative transposase